MKQNTSRALAVVTLCLIFSCSSRDAERSNVAEQAMNVFFDSDISNFTKHLDSAGVAVVDSLFHGTLKIRGDYEISIVRSRELDDSHYVSVLFANQKGLSDTVDLNVFDSLGNFYIAIDENSLLALLAFEDSTCAEVGIELFDSGNIDQSEKWLRQAASRDNISAIYYLGQLERPKDFVKSKNHFETAYKRGHKKAGVALAHLFTMSGNREKGIEILRHEIDENNTEAMIAYGRLCEAPIPPSDAGPYTAFELYKKAATLGNIDAMYSLGHRYEFGTASMGFENAESYIDLDSAFYWYSKSAGLGNTLSMMRLSHLYIEGIYVEKDFNKGWTWLEKSVRVAPGLGYNEIGDLYRYGQGVKVDKAKALELLPNVFKSGMASCRNFNRRIRARAETFAINSMIINDSHQRNFYNQELPRVKSTQSIHALSVELG